MKKVEFDRRCGVQRREFHYSVYIPEKRNGKDRRIGNNAKKIYLGKNNKQNKELHQDLVKRKSILIKV